MWILFTPNSIPFRTCNDLLFSDELAHLPPQSHATLVHRQAAEEPRLKLPARPRKEASSHVPAASRKEAKALGVKDRCYELLSDFVPQPGPI